MQTSNHPSDYEARRRRRTLVVVAAVAVILLAVGALHAVGVLPPGG